METKFSKLNISDRDSNYKNCSYCNEPFTEELWCKECDPFRIMEGWTSENPDIDKFIKDTMYDAESKTNYIDYIDKFMKDTENKTGDIDKFIEDTMSDIDKFTLYRPKNFLEWVPFDRFTDIKEIGEGGFAKVYSATWIDGKLSYQEQNDRSWKKSEPKSIKVALKRLNGSQNMSDKYLNELKIHWKFSYYGGLNFYGLTKYPETGEFMMIIRLADDKGNLRSILLNSFKNIMWGDKIQLLWDISLDIRNLHELGYLHKDFHSGNILQIDARKYISDFGLSGPANDQNSDKVYGVMPYIAPEVLNGEPYTSPSDIYSLGVVMTELSSGKPPFYNKKHDLSLALAICKGLRPEFGKGTPELYKKLAYKCMNANPIERPTGVELENIFYFWYTSINENNEEEEFGYKGKEIKAAFEEANKEIPNISTSYEKNSDAVYISRAFTFSNLLPKPVNSSIITSYVNNEVCDSQLIDLEVSNSIQLRDIDDESKV